METQKRNHRLWLSLIPFTVAFVLLGGVFALASPIAVARMVSPVPTTADQAEPPSAADLNAASSQLTVIESDAEGIVIELSTSEPTVEEVLLQGELFQRFTLPDSELTATPGAPQTPLRSTLLGVPTTEGLAFEILAAEPETRAGLRLAPASRLVVHNAHHEMTGGELAEVFELDAQRYTTDTFYPGPLVELGDIGYMRDQAVFRVTFYPVQYNPVRQEVQFYRRLRVRIRWAATAQAATTAARGSSAVYETLMATTLLNYATLGRSVAPPLATVATASVAPSAQQPRLKLGIDHEGIYTITHEQLTTAGFALATLDPRTFAMTNLGQAVAIYVTGEEDGRFDPGDLILFYGTGRRNDRYTTINVYWLTAGAGLGQRMNLGPALAGTLPTATHFRTTVHAERDTVYWQNMITKNSTEDRWFWERRLSQSTTGFPAARSFPVTLPSPAPVAESRPTLRVNLKGFTNVDHLTQLYVNGEKAGDAFAWAGQAVYTQTVDLDPAWLQAGENLVKVEILPGTNPPGGLPDEILVNWIEIDYWRTYAATGDAFAFQTPLPGDQHFELSGFSDTAVTVLDVTHEHTPLRMVTTVVNQDQIRFQANSTNESRYFAASQLGYQQPVYALPDESSTLRTVLPGIEYIIITHPDFYASAEKLAQHRQVITPNLQTQIVKVDDIYDEFNFGIANPQAIRDYLTYVYTNTGTTPPDYVLLLGDATLDYRGNFPFKMPNYVPTQIVTSTLFGEVPSDNWFVMLAGNDPIPEMFIGRLVAQTATEANIMVDKIINYQPDPSWNKTTLFVADDDETKFRTNSEELMEEHLPFDYITKTVYVTTTQPLTLYRNLVTEGINQGAVLVNYFGHGEHFGWGLSPNVDVPADYIFHKSHVAQLNNLSRLPVITIANCLNGAFAGAGDQQTLAEVLQSADNGGAVAVWAPASIGHPTGHRELIGNFYEAIFADDHVELGKAAVAAKTLAFQRSTRWEELVQTYVLLGDPAMKVGVATTDPYVVSVNPPDGATEVAINRPIEVLFNKPMSVTTVGLTSPAPITFTLLEARDNRLFIFDHTPFAHLTTYTVTVQGQDVVDSNGLRQGPVPQTWSFTTVQDVPPTATITIRAGISNFAGRGDHIYITFSEPVRPGLDYVITPAVTGILRLSNDGRQAVFEHEDFQLGQTYSFTLLSAEDATGNRLSSLSYIFTVGDLSFLPYIPK